jgi:glyoxylase-like metal-dependent hydrolase (beta-lactamase superfamily II)
VGDGAWAAIAASQFAVGNAGLVDLGGEALVFDTFWTPWAARGLVAEAERRGLGPIRFVANSHWHADHVRGNQVFEEATIVSTRRTRELTATRGEERLAGLRQELETTEDAPPEVVAAVAEIDTRVADEVFDERRSFGRAELVTYGGGHTESDAVLHLAEDRILFAADLVVVRSNAWVGDGDVESWLGILERIRGLDFDVIVPGHGPVGSRGDVDAMAEYLRDLLEAAREHGPNTALPERYRDWDFADGWARNLVALTS